MSDTIVRLPQEVVLKIAAGEVVERPASIVKELVENSIDAGASAITVEIQEGGIKYIRVVDNGHGIAENMISLAFERHSTSKLHSAEDLFAIQTLGFRGEALASIAAISKVTLSTKHKDAKDGIRVLNEGGRIVDIKPSAGTQGTSITVKDLFYNTPVRLKFLKKPSSEAGAITEFMLRLILSNPAISFRYVNNGKTIFHSIGDGKLRSAVARVYDVATSKAMKEINYCSESIIVKGLIGILDLEKSNRSHQTFFINGRYFRNDIVSSAVEDACKGLVTISKFPMCVLNITVPFAFVDVNVHPNKLEVRFADNDLVYSVVRDAVLEAVSPISIQDNITSNVAKQEHVNLSTNLLATIKETIQEESLIDTVRESLNFSSLQNTNEISLNDSAFTTSISPVQWIPQAEQFPVTYRSLGETVDFGAAQVFEEIAPKFEDKLRYIGVLFDSFILLEYEDKLLMVDQHAAQERLNFERMMLAYQKDNARQALLSPLLIELNPIEMDIAREYQEQLFENGFEISIFDDTSIAVRAVPMILGEPLSIKACLHELFQNWNGKKLDLSAELIRTRILQSACKHSIKAGEKIPQSSLIALVKQMFEENIAPTCPHGRPIIIEVSKNELYRRFKRLQ